MCCPTGFRQETNLCLKTIFDAVTASAILTRDPTETGLNFYLDSTTFSRAPSTSPSPLALWATGVSVRWRAGDFPVLGAASSMAIGTGSNITPSSLRSTTPTTSMTISQTSSAPTTPPSTNSNTSTGSYSTSDKIALGVGIGLGIPAAIGACVTLWNSCCGRNRHAA